MRELSELKLQIHYFEPLVQLLDNSNEQIRFFALSLLINNFGNILKEQNEIFIPKFMNLLLDTHFTIIDRAIWALSITGEKSVIDLLEKTKTEKDEFIEKYVGHWLKIQTLTNILKPLWKN